MSDDDTRSAEGFTDEPETTVVESDTSTVDAHPLAWSLDDEPDLKLRQPWRSAWGIAGLIAAAGAVALGAAVAIWLSSLPVGVPPEAKPPASPSASPKTVTVTATTTKPTLVTMTETQFLADMRKFLPETLQGTIVADANVVCSDFGNGATYTGEVNHVHAVLTGLSRAQSEILVDDAIKTYCPQYANH